MKIRDEKENKKILADGMRSGFSLMELILVLVVIAILMGLAYATYKKLNKPTMATKYANKVMTVVAAVERSRQNNSDTYPVYSGNIVSNTVLRNALGGTTASKDIQGWRYSCSRSSDTTITITTTNLDDTEVRDMTITALAQRVTPWVVAPSGNAIRLTKAHSVCQ